MGIRRTLALLATTVVTTALAVPASVWMAETTNAQVPAPSGSGTDLQQATAVGGIAPAFQANASNLIRFDSGALDPLTATLPIQAGFTEVDDTSLPATVTQY